MKVATIIFPLSKYNEIVDCTAKEPIRKFIAEWLVKVYASVLSQIGRNAGMKKGFEWF